MTIANFSLQSKKLQVVWAYSHSLSWLPNRVLRCLSSVDIIHLLAKCNWRRDQYHRDKYKHITYIFACNVRWQLFETCRWHRVAVFTTEQLFVSLLCPFPHGQIGRHFADDIFEYIFMNEKFYILNFHWWLFLRVLFTITQHWFR